MTAKTLREIADYIDAEWVGNPNQTVRQVTHPMHVTSAEDLALILSPEILPLLAVKPIETALVPQGLLLENVPNQLRVARPRVALAKLMEIFEKPVYIPPGVHPSAVIDSTAQIDSSVTIGPLCVVGPHTVIGSGTRLAAHVIVGAEVEMGSDCLLHAGVVIGDRVQIGNRVVLQANTTIGNDGFSYVTADLSNEESLRSTGKIDTNLKTRILRINSIGSVVLEDEVELGANCCVDRGTLGETRIKRGTKIDNLTQVAHNVIVGENCLIAAQVGIAGSTKIGDRTMIGGQAGLPDHISIGEDSIIMPQSGVSSTVPAKSVLIGSPAVGRKEFLYNSMQIKRIKGLSDKIKALTRRLDAVSPDTAKAGEPEHEEQPV